MRWGETRSLGPEDRPHVTSSLAELDEIEMMMEDEEKEASDRVPEMVNSGSGQFGGNCDRIK